MPTKFDSLEYCKTCKNRGFDKRVGIICSLTTEQRLFTTSENCPDYDEVLGLISDKNYKNQKQKRETLLFLILGAVSTVLSLALTLFSLSYFGTINIWIIGWLIIGVSLLVHGVRMKKKLSPNPIKPNLEILDN
tara:strand:- start:462 stop:863 length:402 start_codon:yes stop_codon:yes gene_type:complete